MQIREIQKEQSCC